MKTKGLIAAAIAALTLAGTPVAFATSTTVSPAKEIVVQGATGQNLGSGSVGSPAASAQGADQFAAGASNIVQNAREGASSVGQGGFQAASNIGANTAANADAFAGTGTNTSNLDLFQVFQRADKVLTDGATGGIAFLLKLVYYASTLAIILSLLSIVWAIIPGTKLTVWKPLIGLVGSLTFFGIITAVMGVSIFDNPIVSLVKYVFLGQ